MAFDPPSFSSDSFSSDAWSFDEIDVRVSWLQFDTLANPVDVKVSWLQFDTLATPCNVKVSWFQFDTAVEAANEALFGGGADGDEQHYDKHREYARRVYRQDAGPEAPSITETPASIEALAPNTEQSAPNLAAFKADLDAAAQTVAIAKQIAADAIAKAQQQLRDDEEEALLLLLL